ncbi:MAG: hypothetical protein CVV64_16065 [Candidatus Wallbacteria bacterium HGW-Wallbacteria-1]|jgi:hypothetical protein|uniref:Porin n=1 Tax=Candidatus Wallbacteria bacterium HGW-Wallbacteria-1 TaxID=2013854 RepID=A0A2N1PL99_9BACT|nr:MAG: hypothetical protein CVV64_16065 [Candidatus Wallbacteria bacterium HGW-Wallbacteria-1]
MKSLSFLTAFINVFTAFFILESAFLSLPCLGYDKSPFKGSLDLNASWQVMGPSIQKIIPDAGSGKPGRDSLSSTLLLEWESGEKAVLGNWNFDTYMAVRTDMLDSAPVSDDDFRINPYRYWFRLSREGAEIRAGLQKMTFGHCLIFRPLALFDNLNFTDFTRKTDGRRAFRVRLYPVSGTEIQLWMIHNRQDRGNPHPGFRLNRVFPKGEFGLTYHRWNGPEDPLLDQFPEEILAFDFFLDVKIGLWGEYALHRNTPYGDYNLSCIGIDYTFANIGYGLHTGFEYLMGSWGSGLNPTERVLSVFWDIPLTDELTHSGLAFRDQATGTIGTDLRIRRNVTDTFSLEYGLSWTRTSSDAASLITGSLSSPIPFPFAGPGQVAIIIPDDNIMTLTIRGVMSF